jgi:hypothetical protein
MNIFHMRCHVNNKVYNMSINDGCYANMANTTLVKKLNLNTIKHPRPYIF